MRTGEIILTDLESSPPGRAVQKNIFVIMQLFAACFDGSIAILNVTTGIETCGTRFCSLGLNGVMRIICST